MRARLSRDGGESATRRRGDAWRAHRTSDQASGIRDHGSRTHAGATPRPHATPSDTARRATRASRPVRSPISDRIGSHRMPESRRVTTHASPPWSPRHRQKAVASAVTRATVRGPDDPTGPGSGPGTGLHCRTGTALPVRQVPLREAVTSVVTSDVTRRQAAPAARGGGADGSSPTVKYCVWV